jgi:hypothetical protein
MVTRRRDGGPLILRKGLRNDPIVRADRSPWPLATRRGFLKAVGAGAFIGVVDRFARARMGRGGGLAGFYPAGHWVAPLGSGLTWAAGGGAQTAFSVSPRPDGETPSWARHRHLFYNGSLAMNNVIPICARGGAPPYVYEIKEAPAAAAAYLGASYWQPNWTIAQALAAGYGDLNSTPNGTFSAGEFWIRIWDQTQSYLDCIFTSSTIAGYDATNGWGFVFLDSSAGVDPSSYPTSGIIDTSAAPIKTMNWAFGASNTDVTYPNATLVLQPTATVPVFAQNAQYGIQPTIGKSPTSVIAASTPVTVDLTNAGTSTTARSAAFDIQGADFLLQNLAFINGPPTAVNFSPVLLWAALDRILLHNVSQLNAWSGTAPTDNASLFTVLETSTKQYVWMKGCSDSNRTDSAGGTGTEAFALYGWGQCQYSGAELCTSTGCSSYGPMWKWSDGDVTLRMCKIVMASSYKYATSSGDYLGSISSPPVMQNREVCYCILDGAGAGAGTGLLWNQSQEANGASVGLNVSYRNSINGHINVWDPATNNGPYESVNDAIQYGSAAQAVMANNTGGTLPSNMTNTGTDCQAGSGVFNNPSGGDYSLTVTYAAFNGLRGAGIS